MNNEIEKMKAFLSERGEGDAFEMSSLQSP